MVFGDTKKKVIKPKNGAILDALLGYGVPY